MIDNFESYIDSLGVLTNEDLYKDIDETMEARRRDKQSGEDSTKNPIDEN
jgi:hypothetical protein